MSQTTRNRAPTRMFVMAATGALGVIALTSIHHAYAAAIYGTPWRLHIVQVGLPVAVFIAAGLYAGWRYSQSPVGRAAAALGIVAILVFPVAMIGLFEGGYNHVLKNFIYFVFGENEARAVFASQMYEMPNDLLFEATGVAQFPAAIATARSTLALGRRLFFNTRPANPLPATSASQRPAWR